MVIKSNHIPRFFAPQTEPFLEVNVFLSSDLDRDLQEHPELPGPLVNGDQGYVRDYELDLYTRPGRSKAG